VLGALVLGALVYMRIAARFPPRPAQPWFFWSGYAVLALALLSPLDRGATYLFTLHMLQHMLLLLVAPPLIALSVPPTLLGWVFQRPALRRVLRALWAPVPAFVLFNGALLAWHLPAAYDATLRSPWIHAAEHVSFVATGLIFTCSGLFQALGNTWPSLLSSASRLLTFVVPVVLLSRRADFSLMEVWRLSVATVTLQALTSWTLLVREFRRKLGTSPVTAGDSVAVAPGSGRT